jgi:wyosine [tRNA(Phe)-imidazoG37] synthetase (radical SAM superfamily)
MSDKLNFADHNRHFKDCDYVYPVVSRRAEGVSLGINLNLNRACNWRCVYCQVEDLVRGKPSVIDLNKLEFELDMILDWIVNGNFLEIHAPANLQRFNDICLAGNGEPTLSTNFVDVCVLIDKLRRKYSLGSEVKTILITNGSELNHIKVQEGIKIIAKNSGIIWFKLDRANSHEIKMVNQVELSIEKIAHRLKIACELCACYIQSCWFRANGLDPSHHEVDGFLSFLTYYAPDIQGVLLYSTARLPALPEGQNITSVDAEFLARLARNINNLGVAVKYYL